MGLKDKTYSKTSDELEQELKDFKLKQVKNQAS